MDGGHVGGQSPIYKIIPAADHGMWYLSHRKAVSFYSFAEKKQYSDITNEQFQVESIHRLNQKQLLMATTKGLYTVSYKDKKPIVEKYLNADEPVKYLYINDSDLYFYTASALYKVSDFQQQKSNIENIGFQGKINAPFVVDSENRVWLSSEGVLIRFNAGKVDKTLPKLGVATELLISSDKQLWLATRGKGLWQIDSDSRKVLKEYPIDSLHGVALGADTINAIYEDDSGIIWLGRFSTSAAFLNPERNAISNIVNNPWRKQQILNNSVFYLLKHSSNRLWIAHSRGGISVLNPDGSIYGYVKTPRTKVDNKQSNDTELVSTNSDISFPNNGSVYALSEDAQGNVYASLGEQGVYQINPELTSLVKLNDSGTDSGRKFFNLVFDNSRRLYASGNQGIHFYDESSKDFKTVDIKNLEHFSPRTNHSFTDKDDNLWFAGRDYIAVIPKGEASITSTITPSDHQAFAKGSRIRYAYPSKSQQALVGIGEQLYSVNYLIEEAKISLTAIATKQSLSGRLFEDDNRTLWSSHESLNLKTGEHRKFGPAEGLLPHIDRYFAQAQFNNTINIHGSSEGLVLFKPSKITPWRYDTPTVLSKVRFDGIDQEITSDLVTFPANYNSLEIISAALDYSAPKLNRYAYRIKGQQNDWLETDHHGRRITLTNLPPGEYLLELKSSNRAGHWGNNINSLSIRILPAWYESYWFRCLMALAVIYALWLLYRLRVRQLTQRQKILSQTVKERTLELNDSLETLKSTQNQLIESEKQVSLGRLIRRVSHELNTPIGVLKGSNSGLQLLASETKQAFENGNLTPEKLTGLFKNTLHTSDLMAKNIERMAQLTSRFKQSSAEEASAKKLDFHIMSLMETAIGEIRGKANKHDIHIKLRGDPAQHIKSYPIVLKNIIEELLNNSLSHGFGDTQHGKVKHDEVEQDNAKHDKISLGEVGPSEVNPSEVNQDGRTKDTLGNYERKIRLTIRQGQKTTELWLSDNGQGMDKEHQSKLFDPFFSSSHKTEHIGLGMHSVYNWVHQILKGRIQCRAIPGKGCVIKLSIPNS